MTDETETDDATYSGVVLIARERQRQLVDEGWEADHDDEHTGGELARAAAMYATPKTWRDRLGLGFWPWASKWLKLAQDNSTEERIKELAKAGALCAAEIDRLRRKDRI